MAPQLRPRFSAVILVLAALLSFFSFNQVLVSASSPSHSNHRHFHRQHVGSGTDETGTDNVTNSGRVFNSTDADAEELVAMAIAAMRVANKARIEKPSFNKNEFASQEQLAASKEPAPLLKLDVADGDSTSTYNDAGDDDDQRKPSSLSMLRRHKNDTLGAAAPYTVPTQLAAAARKVAESTTQSPQGDHAHVAAAMRTKYTNANNDTNTPPQEKRPEGRLGNYGKSSTAEKRDSSYWMIDEASSGHAPFASKSGYKVSTAVPYCSSCTLLTEPGV